VARSGVGGSGPADGAGDDSGASAFVEGAPDDAAVEQALSGNPNVQAAFAATGVDEALALALVGTSNQGETGDSLALGSEVELLFDLERTSFLDELLVGFLDPVLEGAGIDGLRFQVRLGSDTLLDEFFEDGASALAFFDDKVLAIGPTDQIGPGNSTLAFLLDLDSAQAGAGFSVDFLLGASPIPEPSILLLLTAGLATLAFRNGLGRPGR
jgi:hypothetical protein